MGTALSLTVINKDGVSDIEFYMNKSGSISVIEPGNNPYSFYSEISKEDWQDIKRFIDDLFEDG